MSFKKNEKLFFIIKKMKNGSSTTTTTNSILKEFLASHKTEKGEQFTHTTMAGHGYVPGSYFIDFDEREQLFKLLNKLIFEEKNSIALTERVTENSILRIDIDLRYHNSDNIQHLYNQNDIETIVKTYNDNLIKYLDIEKDSLMCYVMERDEPYQDQNPKTKNIVIKDGIHLMYPNIVLSKRNYKIIRLLVVEQLKNQNQLTNLLTVNTLSIDKMIDDAIAENNWMVYGCSKANSKPYLLTQVLDSSLNNIIDQVSIESEELLELFQVNLRPEIESCRPRDETIFNMIDMKSQRQKPVIQNEIVIDERIHQSIDINLDEIKNLVKLLSSDRADDRNTWIRVGWCLRNISSVLLPEWIQFSKKSKKYVEGECEREWLQTNHRSDGFGIGSLHQWAKEDNPIGYKELKEKRTFDIIKRASNCTHQDVAILIHNLYKDQFVCTDGAGRKSADKVWYYFSNHRWSICDGKTLLNMRMQNEVQYHCRMAKLRINEQSAISTDDNEKNKLDHDEQEINKLIFKLKDASFKDKVLKECIPMFYDEKFYLKLDENIDLMGCENGIYNLKTGEFRDGLPDDYVSLSTGINYQVGDEHGLYDDNHPIIKQVNKFFKKIQPKQDVCDYLKLVISACLFGRNINEHFYILEGVGGNGKSKLIELIEMTLGPYASNIASNFFTQKRTNTSAATPELAKIVHARLVTAQEIEEGEKFNLAILKSFVGNDKITYRPMYGESREIRPKYTFLFAVNHLPTLPADDIGTWRRIRLIRFLARFVDNPDPNSKYEHKKDPLLAERFKLWREAVLFLLFEWHRIFRNKECKLDTPPDVLEATRAYQKQNDQYSEFIDRFTVKKPGGFLQLDSLYNMLKEWWSENTTGSQPNKREFQSILDRRWGMRAEKDRQFGTGWKDRELCVDNEGVVNTTDISNERITFIDI